jgi:hypothetical protein
VKLFGPLNHSKMAVSINLPEDDISLRREAYLGLSGLPPQRARAFAASGPLTRMTEMAALPPPEATPKTVVANLGLRNRSIE